MDEYKRYLADQILSEEKIVTYRSLSRALKTHVNTAKGMLYEFHRSQNAARPGTIHATYLVYGIQKAAKVQEDGDVEMASSPPEVESLSEDVVTHSLTFVPGDRLKEVLATYEEVSSFHIYSLARHPTREPQMLADVSQQIREQTGDDSISMMGTYGSITNPNVRRRDRKGQPPVAAAAPAAKPVKKEPASVASKPAAEPKAEEDAKKETGKKEVKTASKESPFSTAASKKGSAPPTLKKSGSSGIMGSFAKAAAKAASKPKEAPKKEEPANDSPALSDDGEDDDEDIPAAKPSTDGRRSRKEREADLKRMMEEDSEEEPEDKEKEPEDEPEDEPMEEAPEPETETKKEPEPSEVVASSGDGRRRGKRKVMKKKQIMDEQGYLVTTQEAVWEEFSEDEAPPKPATKPKPSSAPSSGSQAKSKKAAPKGQGNIMSFFSKK